MPQAFPAARRRGFRELLAPGYYACSSARGRVATAPRDPPRPPKAPKNRPKPAKTGQNRPKPKKPAKTGMPHDAWKPAKPPRPAKDGQKSGQNRLKSAKIGHGQRAPHRHGPRPGPRRRRVDRPSRAGRRNIQRIARRRAADPAVHAEIAATTAGGVAPASKARSVCHWNCQSGGRLTFRPVAGRSKARPVESRRTALAGLPPRWKIDKARGRRRAVSRELRIRLIWVKFQIP